MKCVDTFRRRCGSVDGNFLGITTVRRPSRVRLTRSISVGEAGDRGVFGLSADHEHMPLDHGQYMTASIGVGYQ